MIDQSSAAVLLDHAKRLRPQIETPHDHALILLAHILGESKTWVMAHPDLYLSQSQINLLDELSTRLANGEPLPYLTGKQAFFGHEFAVNKHVLIPRPETELMVEEALAWLNDHPEARTGIDIGTGSGCIAISLALALEDLRMTAVDIDAKSLALAIQNAVQLGCEDRIRFVQSNLFESITRKQHLLCANLPYIPSDQVKEVNSALYEPSIALDGGESGLCIIEACMKDCRDFLARPSLLLFEFQFDKAEEIKDLAERYFPSAKISILKDLAGLDRILRIEEE